MPRTAQRNWPGGLDEFPLDLDEVPFDLDEVPFDLDEVPFDLDEVPFDLDEVPFDLDEVPFDLDEVIVISSQPCRALGLERSSRRCRDSNGRPRLSRGLLEVAFTSYPGGETSQLIS